MPKANGPATQLDQPTPTSPRSHLPQLLHYDFQRDSYRPRLLYLALIGRASKTHRDARHSSTFMSAVGVRLGPNGRLRSVRSTRCRALLGWSGWLPLADRRFMVLAHTEK